MLVYAVNINITPGPPVTFTHAPFPPYVMAVGDRVQFQLDGASASAGWALQALALNASAWRASDSSPILLGGAFQSIPSTAMTHDSQTFTLPGTTTSFTLRFYASGGSIIHIDYAAESNMADTIIQLGISLTAKSPSQEIYSSHDPQVVLGPQR